MFNPNNTQTPQPRPTQLKEIHVRCLQGEQTLTAAWEKTPSCTKTTKCLRQRSETTVVKEDQSACGSASLVPHGGEGAFCNSGTECETHFFMWRIRVKDHVDEQTQLCTCRRAEKHLHVPNRSPQPTQTARESPSISPAPSLELAAPALAFATFAFLKAVLGSELLLQRCVCVSAEIVQPHHSQHGRHMARTAQSQPQHQSNRSDGNVGIHKKRMCVHHHGRGDGSNGLSSQHHQ